MTKLKQFRAIGNNSTAYGDTPKQAAMNFFTQNPSRRKCDIIEGVRDGNFFTVEYSRNSRPLSFKNVTKKSLSELPND